MIIVSKKKKIKRRKIWLLVKHRKHPLYWQFDVFLSRSCSPVQRKKFIHWDQFVKNFEIIIGPTVNKNLNMCPYKGQKINIYLHLRGNEIRLSEQWCCQRIERIKQLYGDWCFCVVRRGQVFSVWNKQTNCAISGHRGQATFFLRGGGVIVGEDDAI